jgi:hypothetical protein
MKTTTVATMRMYLLPSGQRIQLALEGDLAGGWVGELERCWRALAGSGPGNYLFVDVSRMQSADEKGRALLDLMRSRGVIITGLQPDQGAKLLPWLSRLWNTATHGHRFHVLSISRLIR